MASCRFCGAETQMYEFGNPICIECCDRRDAARTVRETTGDSRVVPSPGTSNSQVR